MRLLIIIFIFACNLSFAQQKNWPILKSFDQDHIQRIAMPIGGIGTGTISLTGRGGLSDWEIMNRPAKGFNPSIERQRAPFFAINVQSGNSSFTRLLEGPVSSQYFEGSSGSSKANHGLPRFDSATFNTAYPFGQANLKDDSLPVDVTVKAYNPLIPGNVDDSSIPVAILTSAVKNKTSQSVTVSLSGNIQNFIGYDGKFGKTIKNKNEFRDEGNIHGIYFTSEGVDQLSEQWGTMALVSLNDGVTTYRTSWNKYHWGSSTLDFWDDFSDDGQLQNRSGGEQDAPMASLAIKSEIAAGEEKEFRFLITWHFPNRKAWNGGWQEKVDTIVGNYYTTQYEDAWDVVQKTVPKLPKLEAKTLEFVNTFIESPIPQIIKEAALFNLTNLRTQLVFRIKEGLTFGWEGSFENEGACFGSCTHVWNYEQTTAFLFGELAKTMREVEFRYATDDEGLMSFRVYLPLDRAQKWGKAAADGQMGSIMQFYREWQLSGDDDFLRKHWPKVKKTLEFSWIKGGWDANKDGVMEGSQHNTMDVEYFGPNPQMGFWYLGALRACEEMAEYLGEKDYSNQCRKLYLSGSAWVDTNLFNGQYYEHQIIPPMRKENVAPSLLLDMGADDLTKPDYQLGNGVLVDQLIGQLMSHFVGLGYLANEENIQRTHEAIMKYNYRDNLSDHVNVMRSYALGDESALLMAAYPFERPKTPFPYFTEVMTGFEYTAAIGMLYEGQIENGLKCIQSIRDRYDGYKRNPFNEAEYGNHYARAMIAWGGILAMTGFNYSAVDQSMAFNAKNGKYFWSNGYQYGTVNIEDNGDSKSVNLVSLNGDVNLESFELRGFGKIDFRKTKLFVEGKSSRFVVRR